MRPSLSTLHYQRWGMSFHLSPKTTHKSSFPIAHLNSPESLKTLYQATQKSASSAPSIFHKTIRIKLILLCYLQTDARKFASPTSPLSVLKHLNNFSSRRTWRLHYRKPNKSKNSTWRSSRIMSRVQDDMPGNQWESLNCLK